MTNFLQKSYLCILIALLSHTTILAQSVTLTPNGAWVPSYTTTARTAITPTDGQLVYDTDTKSFWFGKSTIWTELNVSSADNLGNHTATQSINLGSNYLSNDGTNYGLKLDTFGGSINGSNTYNNLQVGDNTKTFSALRLYTNSKEWSISNYNNKLQFHEENEDIDPFVIDNPTDDNLFYLKNDKIGFGTNTPDYKLDVENASGESKVRTLSTTNEAGFIAVSASGTGAFNDFSTYSGGNAKSRWSFGKDDAVETGSNIGSDFYVNRYDDNGDYLNRVLNINRSNGYMALGGNFNAETQLDVLGTIKASNLKITTDAGAGKILQSDDNGNAGWTVPDYSDYWTLKNTNEIYFNKSGKVGIGNDVPTHKLEVTGDIDSKSAILGDLSQGIAGTNWDLNNNAAGVSGYGGNSSYQAGVYGFVKGTAANTGGVVGVFDLNAWAALAYRDANLTDWGIYSNGSAKVIGTLNTTYLKMTNGATDGYILKSDASGNGTWVASSSLTITESDPKIGTLTANYLPKWNTTTLTNGTIYDNGNIGIGTSSPNSKLDVQNTAGSVKINTQSNTSSANNAIVSPSGQESSTEYRTYSSGTSLARWSMGKNTNAETGSNAGSNFFVNRLNDAGSYAGQPLAIDRANGTTTIGNDGASTTAHTLKINGSMAVKVSRVTTSSTATTLDGDDYMLVLALGTSGNSVVLPTASSYSGRTYVIANRSINTVAISAFINSSGASVTSILASETIQVVSDGTEWIKVN